MTGTILPLLFCLALVLGCAHERPTRLDEKFGEAYRASFDAMVENPGAGWQEAEQGIDAMTAEHVLENYEEGQKAQEHHRPSAGGDSVIFGLSGN